jgi:hypothetical protein
MIVELISAVLDERIPYHIINQFQQIAFEDCSGDGDFVKLLIGLFVNRIRYEKSLLLLFLLLEAQFLSNFLLETKFKDKFKNFPVECNPGRLCSFLFKKKGKPNPPTRL